MDRQKGRIEKIAKNGIYGFIRTDEESVFFFHFRNLIPKRKSPFTHVDRCRLIGATASFEAVPVRTQGEHDRAVNVEVVDGAR